MRIKIIALLALLLLGCSAESRRARHLERAERYFQAGQIDKAEIEYANVLRLDSANKTAALRLAFIYFDQGQPGKAYPLLKQAEQLDPDNLEVHLKLASLYLEGRRFKEVREKADYVLQKQPGHDQALVFLAEAARGPVEIEAVRARLESMREQIQTRPGFHLAIGTLAFREKNIAAAERSFEEASRLGPRLALAQSALGNLYAAQGKVAAAESAYKAAFDLSPLRSSRRFDYIDFKVRNGDIALGRKLLEETIRQAPDHLPALNRLAELTLGEKKFSETAALLRKVLSRDPQNYEALLTFGLLHLAQADSSRAIEHFQRMAAIFTSVPKVHYHLALAFFATNNAAEAVKSLNYAIRLDPEYTDAVLLLADVDTRRGDTSAAIASLLNLTRKQPRLIEAHLLLANAYRLRADLEAALNVYNGLAEIFPKNPRVAILTGSLLLQQNKTNQARAAFERALAMAPNYLPALEQVIALDLAQNSFYPLWSAFKRNSNATPASLSCTSFSPKRTTRPARAARLKKRCNALAKSIPLSVSLMFCWRNCTFNARNTSRPWSA